MTNLVKVYIPTPLRQYVGNQDAIEVRAATVRERLLRHPGWVGPVIAEARPLPPEARPAGAGGDALSGRQRWLEVILSGSGGER